MVERFNVTENEVKNGEVIWYNERKGYGFVKIESAEVFLHPSALDRFGLIHQLTGDQVSVSLATNEHSQIIQDLLTIERPANPAPPPHPSLTGVRCAPWSNSLTTFVAMVL